MKAKKVEMITVKDENIERVTLKAKSVKAAEKELSKKFYGETEEERKANKKKTILSMYNAILSVNEEMGRETKTPDSYPAIDAVIDFELDDMNEADLDNMISYVIEWLTSTSEKLNKADAKPLKSVKTKSPNELLILTDALTKSIANKELSEEMKPIYKKSKNKKKELSTLASIDLKELQNSTSMEFSRELTNYDWIVYNVIASLYAEGGNEYLTPQMINNLMTGNPKATLNPKQRSLIRDSIYKFRLANLTLNADEEAQAHGYKHFKYEGNLLYGEVVSAVINGTVVEECLHILTTPILYEYANMKNHISRVDIRMLKTDFDKTENVLTIQAYLLNAIAAMKRNPKLEKTIRYNTLYESLGVTASTKDALKKKKHDTRAIVIKLLKGWMKIKDISGLVGYTEEKEGMSITKICLEFVDSPKVLNK